MSKTEGVSQKLDWEIAGSDLENATESDLKLKGGKEIKG